jgi:integrase/recombinase XerD
MRKSWSRVKVTGPLAPYALDFGQELVRRGYTELSTAEQVRLMAHLSRWMASEGLRAVVLNSEQAEEYCRARRAQGYTARLVPSTVGCLMEFLRGQSVPASPEPEVPASPEALLLARYEEHLIAERGLCEAVVKDWVKWAALFLSANSGLAAGERAVGAAEVSTFCARELPRRSVARAKAQAAALRSFLRFLHVEGLVGAPLAQAVPPVANRKGTGLPRGLEPSAVARLLASCDRRTRLGRRDYAMLLLLARLGLRAGEVARLALDDIDWRAGQLTVRGKGGRQDRLPLPADVGAAIAGYLRRGRPSTGDRRVFVRVLAPAVGLGPTAVIWAVYSACDRAGLPRVGAHRLRHTLACEALRAGASLIEVGQLLRHAVVGTTAIYAKVDFGALRPLALPWPGRVS